MIRSFKDLVIAVLLIFFLISGSLFYWMLGKYQHEKKEAQRWEQNYQAEKNTTNRITEEKQHTIKELSEQKEIAETLKEENIRLKDVKQVYRLRYRDTGSVRIKTEYRDTSLGKLWNNPITAVYQENCYNAVWTYYPDKDSIDHQWDIETNLQATVHETRKQFRILGLTLFRYGKRTDKVTLTDKCNGKKVILNHELITIKEE